MAPDDCRFEVCGPDGKVAVGFHGSKSIRIWCRFADMFDVLSQLQPLPESPNSTLQITEASK